jgi:Peptidase of plants and bacteria
MTARTLARECTVLRRVVKHRTTWLLTLCAVLILGFSPLVEPAFAAEAKVTFDIANAVSTEDAVYVREGITLAQDYVTATLSDISDSPIRVAVFDNDDFFCGQALACATETSIVVLAGTPQWNSLAPFERVHAIVHEYIHVYQYAMAHDGMETMPAWFIEGMADYLAYNAVTDLGLVRETDVHDFHTWTLAWNPDMAALDDLENSYAFYGEYGPAYSLAYLAIDHLMKDRPLSDLDRFLEQVGKGHNWRASFQKVFERDLNAFYRSFANARDDLVAPRRMPKPFSPVIPEFDGSPLVIDSVSTPVAVGDQLTVLARADAAAVCRIRLRNENSGEDMFQSTFTDGSGHLFWLMTIPESLGEGPATITAACGGDQRTLEIDIAA